MDPHEVDLRITPATGHILFAASLLALLCALSLRGADAARADHHLAGAVALVAAMLGLAVAVAARDARARRITGSR